MAQKKAKRICTEGREYREGNSRENAFHLSFCENLTGNLRGARAGKVPVPASKSPLAAQADLAPRRRGAKYGFPQFTRLFLCALAALRETLIFHWVIIWQGNGWAKE